MTPFLTKLVDTDFYELPPPKKRFHASEDRQWVRDKVFDILNNPAIPFENDFVIVKKGKAHPSIRDPLVLYPKMAHYLLRYIFGRYGTADKIIIFTDTPPLVWIKLWATSY